MPTMTSSTTTMITMTSRLLLLLLLLQAAQLQGASNSRIQQVAFCAFYSFASPYNTANNGANRVDLCLQCFDTVGWAAGRPSGL